MQENDYDDVISFLMPIFGGDVAIWRIWFSHWWADNPAWSDSIPRGWLVRLGAGKPVAFTANIPFKYIINGNLETCYVTGCTASDPTFRRQGLASMVGRAFLNQSEPAILLGVESTEAAQKLWQTLGMKPLNRTWQHINFRVVADLSVIATRAAHKLSMPQLITRIASSGARTFMRSLLYFSRPSTRFLIEQVTNFLQEDEKDLLLCRASSATTYPLRDVETLNWLYFGSAHVRKTRAVFVARLGKKLVGYLSMKTSHHVFKLLECRTLDADPDIARDLIITARLFALRARSSYIEIRPYTPMIEEAMPRIGAIQKNTPDISYYYKTNSGIKNDPSWEAGPGDGDVSVN